MSTVFFFNDTATTEIYTLSLHDALPICVLLSKKKRGLREHASQLQSSMELGFSYSATRRAPVDMKLDRKSTRLNSSHSQISYAVFCLKKKTKQQLPRFLMYEVNLNTNLA